MNSTHAPKADDERAEPRFTVVVPTYQRRDLVVRAVGSLERQRCDEPFEVVVVVDGSQDGSAEALRRLTTRFALTVLEQSNRGAAAARNRGASVARGAILVFIDDDMEADPELLTEHDRSHREGAEVVFGHMPLHPRSPDNCLSAGVKRWSEQRLARLAAPRAELTLHDLLTGQMSVRRAAFDSIGGFDPGFTRGGSFGNEDIDVGYRLLQAGYGMVFNPRAITWQTYAVDPAHHLRQWRDAGHADVAFMRRHPEQAATLLALNRADHWTRRWLWRPWAYGGSVSALLLAPLRYLAIRLIEHGAQDRFTQRLFYELRSAAYWRGVHDAGGIPGDHPVRVLAYHAIADLAGAAVLEPYGVPAEALGRQLDLLRRFGFHVVSAGEFLRFLLAGGGLPRRPVLLTFDDCYEDLLSAALPILEERQLPAVAFAVSSRIGDTNRWDAALGAPQLRLLDAEGLRELVRRGFEIGAHSCTHPRLTSLSDAELAGEVEGPIAELKGIGLPRPRLFAYPYGECDTRVEQAVAQTRLQAAFTIDAGRVRRVAARYRLPRIEVLRDDVGLRFLCKVLFASHSMTVVWHSLRAMMRRLRSHMSLRW